MDETARGAGWLLFAGIMLIVAGTLNIIWGIAAVDNANFFVEARGTSSRTSTPWAGSCWPSA